MEAKDKWKRKGKGGRKRERENDESDSNDDCESQSIDMNVTTIDNNASGDVATRVRFNTRVKSRTKAREERARSEKARKAIQKFAVVI